MTERTYTHAEMLLKLVKQLHMIAATSNEEDGPALSAIADQLASIESGLRGGMLANQAATLREAADRINRSKSFGRHPNLGTRTVSGLIVQWLRTGIATDSAPIAPSPDQLALDRHDAELRKKWEAERG